MGASNQDRSLEDIIAFGSKFEEFCEEIRTVASKLKTDADDAGSVLKDEISKQNIQAIYELADDLKNSVDRGEQPVLELVRRAKWEQAQLEELKGMSR